MMGGPGPTEEVWKAVSKWERRIDWIAVIAVLAVLVAALAIRPL